MGCFPWQSVVNWRVIATRSVSGHVPVSQAPGSSAFPLCLCCLENPRDLNGGFSHGLFNRNFRILKWRYCTICSGRILGVYPLKLRPETIGLTYGIGTSVLNRFLASMAIDLAGGFSSLQHGFTVESHV